MPIETPLHLWLGDPLRLLRLLLAEEYNGPVTPSPKMHGGAGVVTCRRWRFRCCQVFGSACSALCCS